MWIMHGVDGACTQLACMVLCIEGGRVEVFTVRVNKEDRKLYNSNVCVCIIFTVVYSRIVGGQGSSLSEGGLVRL